MCLQIELQVNGTISFFLYHLYFPHSIKIIDSMIILIVPLFFITKKRYTMRPVSPE